METKAVVIIQMATNKIFSFFIFSPFVVMIFQAAK